MNVILILDLISGIGAKFLILFILIFLITVARQVNMNFKLIMRNQLEITDAQMLSDKLRRILNEVARLLQESLSIHRHILNKTYTNEESRKDHVEDILNKFDKKIEELFKSLNEFDELRRYLAENIEENIK